GTEARQRLRDDSHPSDRLGRAGEASRLPGVPKIVDFGIAKIISDNAPGMADQTLTIERRLTPAYASPEQLRPREGEPVTTASDVYSLGVILYELLTGRRPYGAAASASPRDLEQAVCEDPPARPSVAAREC